MKPSRSQLVEFKMSVSTMLENVDLVSADGHAQLDAALHLAANNAFSVRDPRIKEPWISNDTYEMINLREFV